MQNTSKLDAVSSGEPFDQIVRAFSRHNQLSQEAKMLGILYAGYADRNGFAWVGFETLRGMLLRRSKKGALRKPGINAMKRARHELLEGGFLEVEQLSAAAGRFGRVRYRVTDKIVRRREKAATAGTDGVPAVERPIAARQECRKRPKSREKTAGTHGVPAEKLKVSPQEPLRWLRMGVPLSKK
jgi:hypothetical protein